MCQLNVALFPSLLQGKNELFEHFDFLNDADKQGLKILQNYFNCV